MTLVPLAGTISISSCFKCEQVFAFADQLTKSMQEFEIFTMEMELEPKSAKLNARKVLSNFWQLISTIKSFKPLEKQEQENGIKEETAVQIPRLVISLKNHPSKQKVEEKPQAQIQAKADSKSESNSNSNNNINTVSVHTMRTRQKTNPKPRQTSILKWNPNVSASRMEELNKTKEFIQTIKCGSGRGQYNLFECVKCGRQFNDAGSSRRHVQGVHLRLGAPCPTCGTRYFNPESLQAHIPNCIQLKLKKIKPPPFKGGVAKSPKRGRKKSVKVRNHLDSDSILDSGSDSKRQKTMVKIEAVTQAEATQNGYEKYNDNENTKA